MVNNESTIRKESTTWSGFLSSFRQEKQEINEDSFYGSKLEYVEKPTNQNDSSFYGHFHAKESSSEY